MPVAVVKLGSSIVAEDTGALRLSVVARICEEVAALHAAGVDVVVVTSGAIARGIHLLGLGGRPRAVEELQAASRRRPGPALPHLRRVPARARHPVRPGAADVLRHERAHALPERAPDAAQARRVADRAGHQRERHDDHRRDLLRRQRLPGRAGGGAGRRVAAVAADVDAGAVDRRPARRSVARGWCRRWRIPPSSRRCRSASATSPLGSGGMRSKVAAAEMATAAGIPTVIGSRVRARAAGRARGRGRPSARASRRTRCASPRSSSGCATRSRRWGVVAVDAGAARALRDGGTSLLPVGIVGVDGAFEAGDAVDVCVDGDAVGKGISNYSASELRRVMGLKSVGRARGAAARDRGSGPPRLLRPGRDEHDVARDAGLGDALLAGEREERAERRRPSPARPRAPLPASSRAGALQQHEVGLLAGREVAAGVAQAERVARPPRSRGRAGARARACGPASRTICTW